MQYRFLASSLALSFLAGCLDTAPPSRPAVPAAEQPPASGPGRVLDAALMPEEHWPEAFAVATDATAPHDGAVLVDAPAAPASPSLGADADAGASASASLDGTVALPDGDSSLDAASVGVERPDAATAVAVVPADAALRVADAATGVADAALDAAFTPAPDVMVDPAPDVGLDATADASPDVDPDAMADASPDVVPDAMAVASPDAAPSCVATSLDDGCNGIDDDCDGRMDEDFVSDGTCNAGVCRAPATASLCDAGEETACVPGPVLRFDEMLCSGAPCGAACRDTQMLRDPGFEHGLDFWRVLQYVENGFVPDATVSIETRPEFVIRGRGALQVTNRRSVGEFQVQFSHAALPVEADRFYELVFLARSDRPVFALRVAVSTERLPEARLGGNNLGLFTAFAVGDEWRLHKVRFRATGTEPRASLVFAAGATAGTLLVDAVEMRPCDGPNGQCAACDAEPCMPAPPDADDVGARLTADGLSLALRWDAFGAPPMDPCLVVRAPGHGIDGRMIRPSGTDPAGFSLFVLPNETPVGAAPFTACEACRFGVPLRLEPADCAAGDPIDLGVSGDPATGDLLFSGLDETCAPSTALAVERLANGRFAPAGRTASALGCVGASPCHRLTLHLVAQAGAVPRGDVEFWGPNGERMPSSPFRGSGEYPAPPGACTATVNPVAGLDFEASWFESDVVSRAPLCPNLGGGGRGATGNAECRGE
ncbi:hypothetical protein L6V77_29300 [Myxococcota bacterium]|nr:hypothetical protein [Myxococcota bacterium]